MLWESRFRRNLLMVSVSEWHLPASSWPFQLAAFFSSGQLSASGLLDISTIYRISTMNDAEQCCEQQVTVADEEFASWAKALGHPTRVRIVRYLLQQESCTCAPIVDVIGGAQSTVSQHLKILKDAGLIQGTIDGKNTCYCVNAASFRQLNNAMQQFNSIRSEKMSDGKNTSSPAKF